MGKRTDLPSNTEAAIQGLTELISLVSQMSISALTDGAA